MSNSDVLPEHRHLFEVVGTTHFVNNEWMINISTVGLVGKYWNVFVDSITGDPLPGWEFNTDCQDLNEPH